MSLNEDYLTYKRLLPDFRQKFKEVYLSDPDKYDKFDLDKVAEDDWKVLRYLKWHNGNIDKSIKQLKISLQWRHEFGVNTRSEADLPEELFKVGCLFAYGVDKLNRPVVYMRTKVHKKIPRLVDIIKMFLINIVNKIDSQAGAKGFVILFDNTGQPFMFPDMPLIKFCINVVQNHFPYGVRQVIFYNVPRIMLPLWSIVKPFVGSLEYLVKFINGDKIFDFVSAENLPLYLGGLADIDFPVAPEGCKSLKEFTSKYGFTDTEVDKYLKIFEPHMVEAQKLVGREK